MKNEEILVTDCIVLNSAYKSFRLDQTTKNSFIPVTNLWQRLETSTTVLLLSRATSLGLQVKVA